MADFIAGEHYPNGSESGSRAHSRGSSMSSERSNYENAITNARADGTDSCTNGQTTRRGSGSGSDHSSGQILLMDGGKLKEESLTEITASGHSNPAFYDSWQQNKSMKNGDSGSPEIPPRHPGLSGGTGTARQKVIKAGTQVTSFTTASIPEEEIAIPTDGSLASFSADQMATFFRYLRVEDRLINHLHRQGLDGKKFGRLKDADLENLKLNKSPVVLFFRDRTAPAVTKKPKQRLPFIL